MKSPHFNFTSWLTGYSGWSFYCALVSVFGLTGYYSDLLRPRIPDWAVVGLLIAPIVLILFIQWGEAPNRIVAAAHISAAAWFMALALGMEVGILLGYEPRGSAFYRILAHVGWTFAWGGIYRRAKAYSREGAGLGPPDRGACTPLGDRESMRDQNR